MKQISVEHLLLDLQARDIRIWLDEGRMRVSAPQGSLSGIEKEELNQRKAELLAFLQSAERASKDEYVPPIVAVPRNTDLLLSFDQQRMWFLHQMNPDDCAYNLQTIALIKTRPELLQKALNEVVRRHEVLRTRYSVKNDVPLQVIISPQDIEFPLADLSSLPADAMWEEVKVKVKDAISTPFSLQTGPVWRAQLFNAGKGITGMILTIHHIASDGWSLNHLSKEIAELCEAWENGRTPGLESLPFQYADYAQWQRHYLQGATLDVLRDYWCAGLAGMPEILELPSDFKRPAVQTSHGAVLAIDLPKATVDGIQQLAQTYQSTLFMALLSVFKILLFRYSGQTDIVVGTPIAGRERLEIRNVQGLFTNSLVLRTDLAGNPSFVELLQRVRETTLGAYNHCNLPFEKLVEYLQPKRSLSHNPLFQVLFNQLILPPTSDAFRQLGIENDAESLGEMRSYTQQDLAVSLQVKPDRVGLVFSYCTDLFERATIQRMAGHYLNLIENVVKNPQQGIADLPMLHAEERQQLLHAWNNTVQPFADQPTSRLFEAQVAHTAAKIAVEFAQQQVSYAELNRQANRLARHLVKCGVGADVRVGVCVERGVEMLVCILAILKAGGAYVPLDPVYPKERLAYMLQDSAAAILITQTHLLALLPEQGAGVINLDSVSEELQHYRDDNLGTAPGMSDLVYMIYTSGSTGKPKGVAIEHRGLSNLLQSMKQRPGLNQDDTFIALTTTSFDMHVPELFLPLVCGAKMIMASRELGSDGIALASLVEKSGVTTMQATPATWRMLLTSGWRGNNCLKIWTGGEPLSRELADQLLVRSKAVWNLYGPTETTVWSTGYQIIPGSEPVLIGFPFANTQLYIVDTYMQPVPVGVIGELLIGGDGVARGYWNKPELSTERFIRNPFVDAANHFVYRTGDLVKRSLDGNLEYISRCDNQVKLRGFRIELGEIETVLLRQNSVEDAVVVIREISSGDQRLVAYIITKNNINLDEAELRNTLAEFLPTYMLPSFFVFVATFPLTPSGKVDRKALPPPVARQRNITGYIQPKTAIEKTLAAIWCDVLNLEKVSLDDNFFDIGGHSLIAIKSIVQFKEKTGLVLEPLNYYQQTLGQLAASVDNTSQTTIANEVISDIQLEPMFFGSDDRRLFGMARIVRERRGPGVILCHSFAHEYSRCHRAMRELGMRLARAGFHVFSFDYYGTGDSAGEYHEVRFEKWQQDLELAIDTFKQRLGLDTVCLLGMRLGGSLAMITAAKRNDVDVIALWDPIINGADIASELSAIQTFQSLDIVRQRDIERSDVLAYKLSNEMKRDMENINLHEISQVQVRRMLVLETDIESRGRLLAKHLTTSHTVVDYDCVPESRVWMREPFESIVPQQAIGALVNWVAGVY